MPALMEMGDAKGASGDCPLLAGLGGGVFFGCILGRKLKTDTSSVMERIERMVKEMGNSSPPPSAPASGGQLALAGSEPAPNLIWGLQPGTRVETHCNASLQFG
ncbi:MAG: hypothetical protein Q7J76_03870 [Candidatus Brocadiaceae bacterium]|uniref:hypothetical protein n=1 Tax=Candidatus Wunengus sp. YC61 TaxID=3367698 RepID=UPI00271B1A6E|nr:hypothetical protein [Candidatus Brocadiaceae bacterium]